MLLLLLRKMQRSFMHLATDLILPLLCIFHEEFVSRVDDVVSERRCVIRVHLHFKMANEVGHFYGN
jgi:hypothetical protein